MAEGRVAGIEKPPLPYFQPPGGERALRGENSERDRIRKRKAGEQRHNCLGTEENASGENKQAFGVKKERDAGGETAPDGLSAPSEENGGKVRDEH